MGSSDEESWAQTAPGDGASSTPPLLPILRSRQQAELLTLLLGNPDLELTLTDLAGRLDMAYASVHRAIERADTAGIMTSRRIGRSRLVRGDTSSPYFAGLSATYLMRSTPRFVTRPPDATSHSSST